MTKSKMTPLEIQVVSCFITLKEIEALHGGDTIVKFGGYVTVTEALKKTRAVAKREKIKLKKIK